MRAGTVAARNECRAALGYALQPSENAAAPRAGGIGGRADEDEVVVHHVETLHAEPVRDEFFLLRLGMGEQHIGVAAPRRVDGLARALRDDARRDAGLRCEQRQEMAEEAGILR